MTNKHRCFEIPKPRAPHQSQFRRLYRQEWQIVATYIDRKSGRKGKREQGDFSRMFEDAAKRKFDVLMFWSLDRFSREGIRKTIAYLQQLSNLGCRFKSYTEPLLDTENELVAHIVVGVLAYLAQPEAIRISDAPRQDSNECDRRERF